MLAGYTKHLNVFCKKTILYAISIIYFYVVLVNMILNITYVYLKKIYSKLKSLLDFDYLLQKCCCLLVKKLQFKKIYIE